MFYGWIEREELPELEALTDGDYRHGSAWVRLDPDRERDRDRDRDSVLRLLAAIPDVWHLMTPTQRRQSERLQRALFDGMTTAEVLGAVPPGLDPLGPPGTS